MPEPIIAPLIDPNIAVMADRLLRLSEDFAEHRKLYRDDTDKFRVSLASLQKSLDMTRGGYYVLAGLGMIAAWATGIFGTIFQAFHMRPLP